MQGLRARQAVDRANSTGIAALLCLGLHLVAKAAISRAATQSISMAALALVMIVRNEARCLERCLASARPWVDEMVVLDTGSTDATPAIAARCGARVAHAEWRDDFSVARNQTLALTAAPWRLVL